MSQFSPTNYDVQRPSGTCHATGQALEPGDECYSALVDVPPEQRAAGDDLGMRRVDVSVEAWRDGYRPAGLFSYWKTQVPEPNQKKKLFVDDAVLLNLLRRLEDATEPQRLAFRYVVALILLRKKLLRFDGTERRPAPAPDASPPEASDPSGGATGQAVDACWWLFTPKLDPSKGHLGKWNEEETLAVLDPRLDVSRIEQITHQLGEIVEGEI